jgi:hypothetical protein
MEYVSLALEQGKSKLLKNARLKMSEWLDFENQKTRVVATVYLEFSDSRKPQELNSIYIAISKDDFESITLPNDKEIKKENEKLSKKEPSRMIDIKGRFISPIPIQNISLDKENEEHVVIRIELGEFEVDETNMNRFQFAFSIQDSFKKGSFLSTFLGSSWDWSYEAPIQPLIMDKDEFDEITSIKMDLELWVMVEPAMYDSVSDLSIISTRSFDRLVILPENIAKKLEKIPETLCIRWFFPEFSESSFGAGIIIYKKKSSMERERKYAKKINSDPNHFLSTVNRILSDSKVTCVDFKDISDRLDKSEFSRFLEIIFQLLYHRNDPALSRLEELIDILEQNPELRYGKYYLHMFRLLHQMRVCEEVIDIINPSTKKWLEEFLNEPEFISRTVIELFRELKNLVDLIEQFYHYTHPEFKYKQKRKILAEIKKLRDIADYKLINPESYLISEEVLLKWECLVEEEFEKFVGTPKLNVELKTKKLLASERIHLIFEITNVHDVPMMNLAARILPSEQYTLLEKEKRETHKRNRLTKSDDQNIRIFSPEFVIVRKEFPHVQVQLEVEFFTEKGKFIEHFEVEVELFHEDIEFTEIDPNPYIVGGPVKKKKMFYGREKIFKQIRETIVGEKLINQAIVYGQHRIGKTSVLYQLMNVLKGMYVPVIAITHRFETGDSELLHSWSLQIAEGVKNRIDRMPDIPGYETSSDPYKGFQEFLDSVMNELKGAKIIFMIDEYDLIDSLVQDKGIDSKIFGLLERMIIHEKIELVMAGKRPIKNLGAREWRDIGRTFVQIRLRSLDRRGAIKLIKEPVKNSMKYDDSAIERIFSLTNCHPFLVQLCCHVLVNYHNSERKPILNYADVEKEIPDIVELGSPGLEAMISTDATKEEKIVLRVMAAFLREQTSISEEELVVRISKYNPQIKDRDIMKALTNLEEREIIRSVTEEMKRFKFLCDLFKYWIYAKMEPL